MRVNIGSGNGLVPDSTKQSSEPNTDHHHRCAMAFTGEPQTDASNIGDSRAQFWQVYMVGSGLSIDGFDIYVSVKLICMESQYYMYKGYKSQHGSVEK